MKSHKYPIATLLLGVFFCFFIISNYYLQWLLIIIGLLSPMLIVIPAFRKENVFLSVEFWFFGSLLLWSIMYPMDFLLGLEDQYSVNTLMKTSMIYSIANVTATSSFLFFQSVRSANNNIRKKNIRDTNKINMKIDVGIILFVVGILMLVYKIQSMGGLGALGIENRISNFQSSDNSISFPWQTVVGLGLFIIVQSIKKYRLFTVVLIIFSLFLMFFFGARGDILFVCVPSMLYIIYKKNLFKSLFIRVLVIFVIILSMSPLFTNLRGSIIYDKPLSEYEKWEWAYNRGETGGAFRVTLDVLDSKPLVEWPVETYFLEGLSFLPSSIYKKVLGQDKFSSDHLFVETYHPWQAKNGMSFGFSPVAEAWLVGGTSLIILNYTLMGYFISILRHKIKFAFLLPTLMWFQRVSFDVFSSSLFYLIFFYIVAIIMNKLLDVISNKNKFTLQISKNYEGVK